MRYPIRLPVVLASLLLVSVGGLAPSRGAGVGLAPSRGAGAGLAAHDRSTTPSSASVRPARGVIYYVDRNNANASDSNLCSSPNSPCLTIGAAIAESGAGDVVLVAAGMYGEGLTIDHDLTLEGAGAGQTVIDGRNNTGNSGSVVAVTATVEIAAVTIQGGHAAAYGGGIDNAGVLTLFGSTVVNNSTAFIGGGIFNNSRATLRIENSAINSNRAATGSVLYGGGIYNSGAMTLTASAVSGNNAGGDGGGVYNDGSSVTLIASTVSGNTAGGANTQTGRSGGGISTASGLTLINSTVSGNSATGSGGGIIAGGSDNAFTVALYNSTVSGNSAPNGGGIGAGTNSSIVTTIANSIVAGNTNPAGAAASGPDCQGTLTSQGYNLLGNNSGCTLINAAGAGAPGDQIGTPAQPIDPLLGPLQDNGGRTLTQALLPGSPAIDAGNPSGCRDGQQNSLTTDQRGQPRPDPVSGRCDSGAFERQPGDGPTTTPSPSSVPPTATNSPSPPTATNTNTDTPTATNTNTDTPTATNTRANTPIPPTASGTSATIATPTNTPSPSPTSTGLNASTSTRTATSTVSTTTNTTNTTNTTTPMAVTQAARSSTPTAPPTTPTATATTASAEPTTGPTTATATATAATPVKGRGIISTVAGTHRRGHGRDGAQATKAPLAGPEGIGVDDAGNLFIADTLNNVARKVSANSHDIGTVAGTPELGFAGDGRQANRARLFHLAGVATDGHGNLFIVDTYNNRVREVEAGNGRIITVAGTGHNGYRGDGGAATNAWLSSPEGLAVDGHDHIFVADMGNSRIREITIGGDITTVAGYGASGRNAGFGRDSVAATTSLLDFPRGVAVDDAGNIFIADTGSNRVREVEAASGRIITVAGTGQRGDSVGRDHKAIHATLNHPMGVTVDGAGDIFIADAGNNKVREVSACTGGIAAVAGTGRRGDSGDGGPAVEARLAVPVGVALDAHGNLYIADSLNNAIRKVKGVGRAHKSC